MLFGPSSKDVLFRRDVIFDEDFTPVSSPSPSSTYNVDYVTDHVDSFIDQEDDGHHLTENENYQKKIYHQHLSSQIKNNMIKLNL